MSQQKTLCFPYIRYSSDKQIKGTSKERQEKQARDIARSKGWTVSELEPDEGVSAFRGKNLNADNNLGKFLEQAKRGDIPKGSWLIVENLDRLSRDEPFEAVSLMQKILKLGINIYTCMDGKEYEHDKVKNNTSDLLLSVLHFARAHEESETKSKRTVGNAEAIVRRHLAGERAPDGNAYAVNSVGNNMWWSDCSAIGNPEDKIFCVLT